MSKPDARLQIGSARYGGWQSIRIRRSLDEVANSFRLTLTERWPGQQSARPIRPGEAATLLINGEQVMAGFIDEVEPEYDATSHTIHVHGRSKTGDLVDCSGRARHFKNQTLVQICETICKPFGIPVKVQSGLDTGAPFQSLAIDAGQSYFEFLEHAARARAVRLITDAGGALVIMRAGYARAATALELGANVRQASGKISWRHRFSDYIYLGQQTGNDQIYGSAAASVGGESKDSAVGRYRPNCQVSQEPVNNADCQRLAQWLRQTHYGRSQALTYTVAGWHHADGLWAPGLIVPVRDSYMGLDADRLISAVNFSLDESGGERSDIEVMPREAYDLVDVPDPDIKTGTITGWGG